MNLFKSQRLNPNRARKAQPFAHRFIVGGAATDYQGQQPVVVFPAPGAPRISNEPPIASYSVMIGSPSGKGRSA
ncbi:MAG TPA: hypothetical protein VLE25_02035 [Nitrospira sp.]|nr:hypothetical protein [Nitrospira sp.]